MMQNHMKAKTQTCNGVGNIHITGELSKGGEFEFVAKLLGSYLKNLPKNLRNKMCIIEYLKQNKVQFNIVPDREISLKL